MYPTIPLQYTHLEVKMYIDFFSTYTYVIDNLDTAKTYITFHPGAKNKGL
jgi:hypothetical protein